MRRSTLSGRCHVYADCIGTDFFSQICTSKTDMLHPSSAVRINTLSAAGSEQTHIF